MNGIVAGGWSFVWAAYLVSATILITYSIHTVRAFRKSVAKRALTDSTKEGAA